MSEIYGYVRVSTKEQNIDRQITVMENLNVPRENIFIDRISGKNFCRPMYQKLLGKLGTGALLCISSIDRLGRNYKEITREWQYITGELGTDIIVADMPLLNTQIGKDLLGNFISDLVLQILSFVAENERKNILQRQSEGIEAAKERGVKFGRPPKALPPNFYEQRDLWLRGETTLTKAAKTCKMPLSTFYAKVKLMEKKERAADK